MTDDTSTVVFRTQSYIEANIVRGLLKTHGIKALVFLDGPHRVFPVTVGGLGDVRLTVTGKEAGAAVRLIGDFRNEVSDRVTRICDEFRSVEEAIGYQFRDRGLLEHALTHRSRTHEDASGGMRDNESLEFLGDAVLGFLISDRLFRECPDWNEGQKSKAKAMIVSRAALARVGEKLGLGEYLLLGRGEEKTGGRRKRSLIADTLEAVVAAIYLDGGIEAVERFIGRSFRPQLDAVREGGLTSGPMVDHKSALQEQVQSRNLGLPRYRLARETGPPHRKVFEMEVWVGDRLLAHGAGGSKKQSGQQAAERALQVLAMKT